MGMAAEEEEVASSAFAATFRRCCVEIWMSVVENARADTVSEQDHRAHDESHSSCLPPLCFDILHDMEENEELLDQGTATPAQHIVVLRTGCGVSKASSPPTDSSGKTLRLGDVCAWHPNMLKHGRLVVDDEDEAVAASRPTRLEYGDRLMLVNGRVAERLSNATNVVIPAVSRLVFWRASSPAGPEHGGKRRSRSVESALPDVGELFNGCTSAEARAATCAALLCYIIGSTSASFVSASRTLKRECERREVSGALKGLSAFREEIECLATRRDFATIAVEERETVAAAKVVPAVAMSVQRSGADGECAKNDDIPTESGAAGDAVSTVAFHSCTETPSTTSTNELALQSPCSTPEPEPSSPAETTKPPTTTVVEESAVPLFRCKSCRLVLFAERHTLPCDNYKATGKCTASYFVEGLEWMKGRVHQGERQGKLLCPKCKAKLGSYSWIGLKCGCGQWRSPAFQIHTDKVDEFLPVAANAGVPPCPFAEGEGQVRAGSGIAGGGC